MKAMESQLTFLLQAKRPAVAVKFFSKLNYLIFGYFDPTNILFDIKNKFFLGWPKRYFG